MQVLVLFHRLLLCDSDLLCVLLRFSATLIDLVLQNADSLLEECLFLFELFPELSD